MPGTAVTWRLHAIRWACAMKSTGQLFKRRQPKGIGLNVSTKHVEVDIRAKDVDSADEATQVEGSFTTRPAIG